MTISLQTAYFESIESDFQTLRKLDFRGSDPSKLLYEMTVILSRSLTRAEDFHLKTLPDSLHADWEGSKVPEWLSFTLPDYNTRRTFTENHRQSIFASSLRMRKILNIGRTRRDFILSRVDPTIHIAVIDLHMRTEMSLLRTTLVKHRVNISTTGSLTHLI